MPAVFIAAMIVIQILGVAFSPLELRYQTASAVFRLVGQVAPLGAACVEYGLGRVTLERDPLKGSS
jgi:hypothetical protein